MDDKKRFESGRNRESQQDWADTSSDSSKPDWRHEPRPLADLDTKAPAERRNPKDWDKEEEARERPQRPDSRGSRESRASRDSIGSLTQREKKIEVTSWADSTCEFDDYYKLDLRDDHSRSDSLLKDFTLHESPMRAQDAQDKHESTAYEDMIGSSIEPPKEAFRSGAAPAPITKERLEAAESEKEVRKNMTTLRRNQDTLRRNPPRDTTTTASTTTTTTLTQEGRQSNSAWSNNKPKNGDRSRPDFSGTMAPAFSSNTTTTTTTTTTSTTHNSIIPTSSICTTLNSETGTVPSVSSGGSLWEKGTALGASKSSSSSSASQPQQSAVSLSTKKETENVWNQPQQQQGRSEKGESHPVPAAPDPSSTSEGATEKGQGAAGSKNQLEAASAPQTLNKPPQQSLQKAPPPTSAEHSVSSKKVFDAKTLTTTPAQESSSTANESAPSTSSAAGDAAKTEKHPRKDGRGGEKVGGGSKGGRGASGRYDSAPPRGNRGGRGSVGSYPLYRGGRGSRGDYRRGGGSRGGNPPRFQNNRNMRSDDYQYFYDYGPQRKVGKGESFLA